MHAPTILIEHILCTMYLQVSILL